MEIAEIKEESCTPLDLVQRQNKQILLDDEHCDELNEAVAEWIWLRSSSDIFCKCEQLKHENRVMYCTKATCNLLLMADFSK